MVSLLSEVANENSLATYKKNLENNQGRVISEVFVATIPDLVGQVTELTQNILEITPQIIEGDLSDLLESLREEPDRLVFITNNSVELPWESINKLVLDFEIHKAGFVTGVFKEYPVPYFVNDIYAKEPMLVTKDLEGKFALVDITLPYGLVALKSVITLAWGKSLGLSGYSFGVKLRRLGYQNYVDTNIKYRYLGGK